MRLIVGALFIGLSAYALLACGWVAVTGDLPRWIRPRYYQVPRGYERWWGAAVGLTGAGMAVFGWQVQHAAPIWPVTAGASAIFVAGIAAIAFIARRSSTPH